MAVHPPVHGHSSTLYSLLSSALSAPRSPRIIPDHMSSRGRLLPLALTLSVTLHGAAFAALSICLHHSPFAAPRIALPLGSAAGLPVLLIASTEPDIDALPRLDESKSDELLKASSIEPAAPIPSVDTAVDPEPLESHAVASRTALEAVTEPISTGATTSLADGRPSPGGAPGVLTGPTPAAGNPPPDYPAEARRKHQEGTVILRVIIEPDGRVAGATVARSSGFELLDRAALDAARVWRFLPARDGDAAVRCTADLPVEFVLRAPTSMSIARGRSRPQ